MHKIIWFAGTNQHHNRYFLIKENALSHNINKTIHILKKLKCKQHNPIKRCLVNLNHTLYSPSPGWMFSRMIVTWLSLSGRVCSCPKAYTWQFMNNDSNLSQFLPIEIAWGPFPRLDLHRSSIWNKAENVNGGNRVDDKLIIIGENLLKFSGEHKVQHSQRQNSFSLMNIASL